VTSLLTEDVVEIKVQPDFRATLTRAEFVSRSIHVRALALTDFHQDEILKPSLESSFTLIEEALKEAKVNASSINDLLLVGSSTRIPKLKETLEEHLGRRAVEKSDVEPDQAVVIGAAKQAAILSTDIGSCCCGHVMDVSRSALGIACCL
jgi:heat shock protein 1/8